MLTLPLLLTFIAPQEPVLEREWEFPLLGQRIYETRWLDAARGTITRQSVNQDGLPVDLDAMRRAHHAAQLAQRGKLAPELVDKLAEALPEERMDIVLWLKSDDAPDWRVQLDSWIEQGIDQESARRLARDASADFFSARVNDYAEYCQAQGWEVTQTLQAWPVVYLQLPASEVRAAAADTRVDEAYYCFPGTFTEQVHAQATLRTPLVWDSGLTAAGSPVKTMVNDPEHVTSVNPYLPPIVQIYGSGRVTPHASAVAGNIAMDDGIQRGAAYGIPQLYSANGTGDIEAPLCWDAAISNGVSFGNCSWWNGSKGQIVYLDRYFDYTIRNFGMMMFKSTGNQGNTSTPYTTSPGNGYNSTNTGSYSDGDNSDWAGDSMASYSSYWDPVEGHEKPELASPGDEVVSTDTFTYYNGFGGTSSASPLTCGVATLLATRDNDLMTQPEVVKAVLMASAWHNVEGDDLLSERDGAGGVHALAADRTVAQGNFHAKTLTTGDFGANNAYEITIPAAAGNDVRVCALWFSTANSAYSTDVLNMDLDMVVLDPSGAVVGSGSNASNPFELVRFTPTTTGLYTVRLINQRFDGSSEPMAVAWSSKYDMAEAELSVIGTPQVGGVVTLEFEARYRPNVWYQAHVSGGTFPSSTVVGSGFVLPLEMDSTFAASGAFPGMTGTLNSAGFASTALQIPNNAALANRDFYLSFYTKPSSGSSTVSTVAQAVQVTVQP